MALDPQSLLSQSQCYTCFGASTEDAIELALLSQIAINGTGGGTTPTNPVVLDWAARVVTNGGAAPSAATIACVNTFYLAAVAAGLTAKWKHVNVFAPDNFIAATTPLIKLDGFDPWVNHGFVAGDLTVNGILGDGVAKWFDSGVQPRNYASLSSDCISTYIQSNNGVPACQGIISSSNDLGGGVFAQFRVYFCNDLRATMHQTGTDMTTGNTGFRGYVCSSRIAANQRNLYWANSTTPHASIFTDALADGINSLPTNTMPVFATSENTVISLFLNKRLSYASFGLGLTQAESLAEYNAVVALRTCFGGGLDTGPNTP